MKVELEKSLPFDPLDGDDGERKVLSDKIVKGRKNYSCDHCNSQIIKGDLHRAMTDKFDGELGTYRYCADCCTAMISCLASGNIDIYMNRGI